MRYVAQCSLFIIVGGLGLLLAAPGGAVPLAAPTLIVATATPAPTREPLPTCPYTPLPLPHADPKPDPPPAATETPIPSPVEGPTPAWGTVQVLAWADADGDGARDEGETGWGGLTVLAQGEPHQLNGEGHWNGVYPPGPLSLSLQLPAGATPTTAPSLETNLLPGGGVLLQVGIRPAPNPTPTATPTASPTATRRPPREVTPALVVMRATDTPTPTVTTKPTETVTPTPTTTPTATPTPEPVWLPLTLEEPMPSFPVFELFLGLIILILSVLLAGERVRSAFLRQERSQYALGLQQLALQRARLGRTIVVPTDSLLATANQIAFDVLGEPVEIDQLFDVRTEVPLAMTFAHRQRRFFTFTPQPERARGLYPGGHWFTVDALTAHPFVAEELAAAFATAVSIRKPGEHPLLPRSEQWGLVVWEAQRKRRSRLRWPWIRGNRRWWLRRVREVGA